MLPQKPDIRLWAGTRSRLILSYTPGKVCYYLQPLTFDFVYLCMIHSLISARHQRKSESSRLLLFGYEVFEERAGPQKSFS